MIKDFILIFFIIVFSTSAYAQLEASVDFKRQVYDREYTVGPILHSKGYAVNGRYLKYIDGYNKIGIEIDIAKLRHSKEIRTPNQFSNSSRGYVYGRINTFYTLRAGYIREKILFDKTDRGTISISLIASGGISLGLLKPVYVQVYRPASSGFGFESFLKTEQYRLPNISGSVIYGEANFLKGIKKTVLKPGIYGKVGASFDFDLLDGKVTSLETGVIYDYFFNEVEIFYENPNGEDINIAGFFQLYFAVNFGYKKS